MIKCDYSTYLNNCQRFHLLIISDNSNDKYYEITIPGIKFNYEGIVDAIVTVAYPNDKMQAIINNYLLDQSDESFKNEFLEMQNWRKEAKRIAKTFLK
jgi:hypothetical protein